MNNEDQYKKIWQVIAAIPKGSTSSYAAVARKAGKPRGARMVVRALKLAPNTLNLPWHRVIRADNTIGFDEHSEAFKKQKMLLEAEGVRVQGKKVLTQKNKAIHRKSIDESLWKFDD